MNKKEMQESTLLKHGYRSEIINDVNYKKYHDLLESVDYLRFFSGIEYERKKTLEEINNPSLPPNGKKDNNHFHGIIDINDEPVAWIKFYEGFPNSRTIFVGEFYIHKKKQQNGIGTTILKSYELIWKNNGFENVLLNVDLKNWEGLQFWIKNNYRNIEKYFGDKYYSIDTYAMLRLLKDL